MYLRKLKYTDAPLMLSWMHDKNVTKDLKSDFSSKTIEDAVFFIKNSLINTGNLNLAISSDEDEYMGTVSLRFLDGNCAEFAITVRTEAMGRGYSWYGMQAILEKGFNDYNLTRIYWCVSVNNHRAIRFYDKHNFHEVVEVPQTLLDRYEGVQSLKWYLVTKDDYYRSKGAVAGCKVIHIKTISSPNGGELSFFEGTRDFSFEIKRIYYISKVPNGMRRGFHAHKKLKQLLFCPFGKIRLILENKNGRDEIVLSDSSLGVLIDQCTWREMVWLQEDSVLCVAASDYYDANDYIRDYKQFLEYIRNPENK